jgi:hypothetical protein
LLFEQRLLQSQRLARACAWLEALLFAASAALLARTAARADAAAASLQLLASGWRLELLCALLAGWVAWHERRGEHARWLALWDDRLGLRGALVTAHEHRSAASAAARALLARVGSALPSWLGLWRRAPVPFAALAVSAAALALWWGTTPLVLPPWRAPAAELAALASGVARAGARLDARPALARAGADQEAMPAASKPHAAAHSALAAARELLAAAARAPQDPVLVEQARTQLERLRASGALEELAAGLPNAAANEHAAGVGVGATSAARERSTATASPLGAAGLRPSQREAELAARWTEARRVRFVGASGAAR